MADEPTRSLSGGAMHTAIVLVVVGLSACSFLGCDKSDNSGNASPVQTAQDSTANDVPLLVVDSEHSILEQKGGVSKPYTLKGGGGVMLDAAKITLADPQKMARSPNMVQVIYDKSLYEEDWPPNAVQVRVDSTTLNLIKGQPFSAFKRGTQAHIAIGYGHTNEQTKTIEFTPFWVGSVLFI